MSSIHGRIIEHLPQENQFLFDYLFTKNDDICWLFDFLSTCEYTNNDQAFTIKSNLSCRATYQIMFANQWPAFRFVF